MRRHWLLLIVLSLALSLGVPLYLGGLEGLFRLLKLPAEAVVLLLALVLGEWLFHAARLPLLAHTLGYRLGMGSAVSTVVAAEFAGLATPAGTGAGATYIFLLNRKGLPVGMAAGLSAVNLLIDIVFFATALPVVAIVYLLGDHLGATLPISGVVIGLPVLGLTALVAVIRYHRRLALWVGHRMHRTPRQRRLRFRLARLLIQFRQSVRLLARMGWQRLLLLYVLCTGRYLLRYALLPVVLIFLGHAVPWEYLFITQAVALFVGVATFLPGGGGGVEVGMGLLLRPYLDAATISTALLAWRFLTFYWYMIVGGVVFVLTTGRHATQLIADSGRD